MLSQTCEYALRAATYIVRQGDDKPVLAKDIAAETEVPLRYLQKILRDLVRAGILRSARGIGGGFRLDRPANELFLSEVMGLFDDTLRTTTCPFGNEECGVRNLCPVHERWSVVVEAYREFLLTTTLEDLKEKDALPPPKAPTGKAKRKPAAKKAKKKTKKGAKKKSSGARRR